MPGVGGCCIQCRHSIGTLMNGIMFWSLGGEEVVARKDPSCRDS